MASKDRTINTSRRVKGRGTGLEAAASAIAASVGLPALKQADEAFEEVGDDEGIGAEYESAVADEGFEEVGDDEAIDAEYESVVADDATEKAATEKAAALEAAASLQQSLKRKQENSPSKDAPAAKSTKITPETTAEESNIKVKVASRASSPPEEARYGSTSGEYGSSSESAGIVNDGQAAVGQKHHGKNLSPVERAVERQVPSATATHDEDATFENPLPRPVVDDNTAPKPGKKQIRGRPSKVKKQARSRVPKVDLERDADMMFMHLMFGGSFIDLQMPTWKATTKGDVWAFVPIEFESEDLASADPRTVQVALSARAKVAKWLA